MIYIFSLSLFSLYLSLTRFRVWSPASFFSIFLFMQLVLYFLFINNFVPQSAYFQLPIPYNLIGAQKTQTFTFYFILLLFFSLLILFSKKKRLEENVFITDDLVSDLPRKYVTFASILILLLSLNYAIDMNWSIILEHSEYLDAGNAEKLGLDNVFSIVFNSAAIFFACLVTSFYFLCKKRNFTLEKNIFLIIFLFLFILIFARGSRAIILIFITYASCETLILKKKLGKFKLLLYLLICFQLFSIVIGIRAKDFGGLVHIAPDFFDISIDNIFDNFISIYQNVCFGVINFDISLNYNPRFSAIHKFLSNSPLLSAIDGFRDISQEQVYKINIYAPFNSYAEAYHFGIFFLIYFCIIQVLSIVLISLKTNEAYFLFYLPATLFSYMSIIYSSQYSVRTSTKYIFLSYIFFFAASYYLKRIKKKTPPIKLKK